MKRRVSFLICIFTVFLYQLDRVAPVVVPSTNCYVYGNSSRIYDFSSWHGKTLEYEVKETAIDFAIRFCKDVESRSQAGYIAFGRFDNLNYFVAGSGRYDFVQEFYNGDLQHCETTYDKRGRTTQLNIICGDCPNGRCKGGLDCVCNVTFESDCRLIVELAIPCEKPGPQVFEGFTVGYHPRSWEVVYNGMTQLGYEKAYSDFSFETDQTHVALYMTAIASVSHLVQKPTFEVFPKEGLEVSLSGSGATGSPPTTLSPTLLIVNWRCEIARDIPYEVQLTIPVEGYDPIQFTLTKMCEFKQDEEGKTTKGWALFGVLSCIFFVFSTLFCCGGFIYKTQAQNQRGLDALPGMTILSACLETMSGGGGGGGGSGYMRSDDLDEAFASQASWTREPTSAPASLRNGERRYGT